MNDKKQLSDDDKALFRDAIGDVKSVANDKAPDTSTKPAPRVTSTQRDDRSVMEALLSELSENDLLETGEHLSYTAPGVQRAVLRKLKSGNYAIQAELDLHGLTLAMAKDELGAFLLESQHRRLLCVRIIHGKGRKTVGKIPTDEASRKSVVTRQQKSTGILLRTLKRRWHWRCLRFAKAYKRLMIAYLTNALSLQRRQRYSIGWASNKRRISTLA